MSNASNLLKALVVEDSLVTQRLVLMFLNRIGFEVILIDNGVDAIELLKQNHYDAIFLDVIMPEVDGYSVCKFIKSRPDTKSIPVIMLTSKNGMFDKVRGRMSGADVYLVKPINHSELIKAVNKFYPISNGILDVKYESDQPITQNKQPPSLEPQPTQKTRRNEKSPNKVISLAEKIKQARINNKKNMNFNK